MNTTTAMMASQSQTRTWLLGTTTNLTIKQSFRVLSKRFVAARLYLLEWCDQEAWLQLPS